MVNMQATIQLTTFIIISTYAVPPNTRYVMDDDNEIFKLLPFPIDVCFESSFHRYTRYECSNDGSEVYRKVWNETTADNCNANTNGLITATFNDSIATSCNKGNFNCTGTDNYIFHNLWRTTSNTPPCDEPSIFLTIPTVTGCFCVDTASLQTSCTDAYNGNFNRYNDSALCATAAYFAGSYSNESCTLIYKDVILSSTMFLYSELESCTVDGATMNKTPSPTIQTPNPTTAQPTSVTPSPISWSSRFIIDNDWLFGDNYPFPIDQCLQTQPLIPVLGKVNEFIFYECSPGLDQVTKYKWTVQEVPGLSAPFDCNNKSIANTTVFTLDTHQNDICNQYYFNCQGNDNYVVTGFDGFSGTDCTATAGKYKLFNISIATDTCFCGESLTSHTLACNQNESTLYDFSGTSSCVSTPTATVIAKKNECSFYKEYDFGAGLYNIYGTLQDCVENRSPTGSPTIAPTIPTISPTSPTDTPSNSPTTPIPTAAPVISTAAPSRSPLLPGQTHPPTTGKPSTAPVPSPTTITHAPNAAPSRDPTDTPIGISSSVATTDDDTGGKTAGNGGGGDIVLISVIIIVVVIICCFCLIILWLGVKKKRRKRMRTSDDIVKKAKPKHMEAVKSKDIDNETDKEDDGGADDEKTTDRIELRTDDGDNENEHGDGIEDDNVNEDSYEQYGDYEVNPAVAETADLKQKRKKKRKPAKSPRKRNIGKGKKEKGTEMKTSAKPTAEPVQQIKSYEADTSDEDGDGGDDESKSDEAEVADITPGEVDGDKAIFEDKENEIELIDVVKNENMDDNKEEKEKPIAIVVGKEENKSDKVEEEKEEKSEKKAIVKKKGIAKKKSIGKGTKKKGKKKEKKVVVDVYDVEEEDDDIDVVEYEWNAFGAAQSKKLKQNEDDSDSDDSDSDDSTDSDENDDDEEKDDEYTTPGGN